MGGTWGTEQDLNQQRQRPRAAATPVAHGTTLEMRTEKAGEEESSAARSRTEHG